MVWLKLSNQFKSIVLTTSNQVILIYKTMANCKYQKIYIFLCPRGLMLKLCDIYATGLIRKITWSKAWSQYEQHNYISIQINWLKKMFQTQKGPHTFSFAICQSITPPESSTLYSRRRVLTENSKKLNKFYDDKTRSAEFHVVRCQI